MKILAAVLAFAFAALSPLDVPAQPARKPARIAYVWLFDSGPSAPYASEFRNRLTELGWKEGQNIQTEYHDAHGDPKQLAAIMEGLARAKVDLIVAMCTPEAVAARKATSTIPIVVTAVGDPVAAGLVESLAKPGGNVTGVSAVMLPLSAKRVELLKEAFPGVKRATVLWNPQRPDNAPEVRIMQETAKRLGFEMQSQQVRTKDELATALEMLAVDGTQAILNTGDTLLSQQAPAVVRRAAELRIPGMYEARLFPDHGGLMSYGPNLPQMHRRAAEYADRILKGARPADLPMEQPSRFELVINMKAAKSQGFEISRSLILRADHLIE